MNFSDGFMFELGRAAVGLCFLVVFLLLLAFAIWVLGKALR